MIPLFILRSVACFCSGMLGKFDSASFKRSNSQASNTGRQLLCLCFRRKLPNRRNCSKVSINNRPKAALFGIRLRQYYHFCGWLIARRGNLRAAACIIFARTVCVQNLNYFFKLHSQLQVHCFSKQKGRRGCQE